MIQILVPALAVVSIATAAYGLRRLGRGEDPVRRRLKNIRVVDQDGAADVAEALWGGKLPFWMRPVWVLSYLLPGQASSEVLRWELARAGHRHIEAPRVFVGLRVLLTSTLGSATWWLASRYFDLRQGEMFVVVAVAAAIGFMGPYMMLRVAQNRRRMEITLSLPDALDLLVICVEAGQGLNAALLSVTRETHLHSPALAGELRVVNLEMSTGVQRAQALRNFALRTGVDDVRGLVAVLVQSDRFGTSIAQALRTHARSLRIRRRQRAEEAARKTPVKMVFPLVFCVFPALLVVILAPGFMELMKSLSGAAG